MRHAHTTAGRDVEAGKVAVLVNDGNKTDVVGEDIDIICRWNSNRNFELPVYVSNVGLNTYRRESYLSRQIKLAVQRLDVLQCVTSNELLVQPDLVVRSRTRKQVLADAFREVISLCMQIR